jgi:hypothetical protein
MFLAKNINLTQKVIRHPSVHNQAIRFEASKPNVRFNLSATENPCVAGSIPAHTTDKTSLSAFSPEGFFILVEQPAFV